MLVWHWMGKPWLGFPDIPNVYTLWAFLISHHHWFCTVESSSICAPEKKTTHTKVLILSYLTAIRLRAGNMPISPHFLHENLRQHPTECTYPPCGPRFSWRSTTAYWPCLDPSATSRPQLTCSQTALLNSTNPSQSPIAWIRILHQPADFIFNCLPGTLCWTGSRFVWHESDRMAFSGPKPSGQVGRWIGKQFAPTLLAKYTLNKMWCNKLKSTLSLPCRELLKMQGPACLCAKHATFCLWGAICRVLEVLTYSGGNYANQFDFIHKGILQFKYIHRRPSKIRFKNMLLTTMSNFLWIYIHKQALNTVTLNWPIKWTWPWPLTCQGHHRSDLRSLCGRIYLITKMSETAPLPILCFTAWRQIRRSA